MILSPYQNIDTPALLIDLDIAQKNIESMQAKANSFGVALRPHTKTHKMPYLALKQIAAGARGITVAKIGEAEVMADAGIDDIFIANEIVGSVKYARLRQLAERIELSIGADNEKAVCDLDMALKGSAARIGLCIEVEVGEVRSGIEKIEDAVKLAQTIRKYEHLYFKGIFCHEGHCYKAETIDHCRDLARAVQERMLAFAQAIRDSEIEVEVVSIGSTPSMLVSDILPGINEIRPGTYILMDAAQGQVVGDFGRCAASVLGTVMSIPTDERVITDTGAKALTAQKRTGGICNTPGNGLVKGSSYRLQNVFDEHGIIIDRNFRNEVKLGDKTEIIPNHICPCVNLYNFAWIVSNGKILAKVPVAGRGKTQ